MLSFEQKARQEMSTELAASRIDVSALKERMAQGQSASTVQSTIMGRVQVLCNQLPRQLYPPVARSP